LKHFQSERETSNRGSRKIPNPGNSRFTLDPYHWTIDRNENVILLETLGNPREPFMNKGIKVEFRF